MATKKKFYIGSITERNGEFEYSEKFIFSTGGSPYRYADKIAKNWRGEGDVSFDEDEGGYWSGHTVVSAGSCREIPEEDFEVLKKYICKL